MFTAFMIVAILSVLQWVFLIVGGLYLMAAAAIAIRQDEGLTEAGTLAVIASLASGVIWIFRRRLTSKSGKCP